MKLVIVFIFLLSGLSIYGQSILTRGEVYDFEVGDEFHYKYGYYFPGIMVDRYTVLVKDFSTDNDTVIYTLFKSKYSYSEYGVNIEDYTIVRKYTNLEEPITTFGDSTLVWDPYLDTNYYYYPDTIINYDSSLCNILVNGYDSYPPEFESNQFIKIWGRGVGEVYEFHYDPSGYSYGADIVVDRYLHYYKKGSFTCGTPIQVIGIDEIEDKKSSLKIYPNPSNEKMTLELGDNETLSQLNLYNSLGENQLIDFIKNGNLYMIETSSLSNGMYYLKATINDDAVVHRPVVISH